ncbi:MAG: hypothetical protein HQL03_04595 [Nitrospirae bacterium]|nr:hypothetical protein [Nitrospirota bacterium]
MIRDCISGRLRRTIVARALWIGILLIIGIVSPAISEATNYNLNVSNSPSTGGTITSSPTGINCGSTCTHSYSSGTNVTLTETPAGVCVFSNWTSGSTVLGTSPTVSIAMSAAKTVVANYTSCTPYTLNVSDSPSAGGSVTSTDGHISCGATCSYASYSGTASVTLTAVPATGYTFSGWTGVPGGACTGTSTTCTFNMTSSNQNVIANFTGILYGLTVTNSPSAGGSVTSTDGHISCGATCSYASYSGTASVTLTAAPAAGYSFAGWSGVPGGACSGTSTTCTFSITNSNQNITANFNAMYTLTVSNSPSAGGTVTSSDSHISCGTTCSYASYSAAASVTLTAAVATGYTFANWSGVPGGACTGTSTSCTFSMGTSNQNVTANYTAVAPPYASPSNITQYCSKPPFIAGSVPPNIMILLDNSGSMIQNPAYPDGGGACASGATCWCQSSTSPCNDFNPTLLYFGLFDPTYWYSYSGGGTSGSSSTGSCCVNDKFSPTVTKTTRAKTATEWDGNFLNWLTMRRIDVAKAVLTGGKVMTTSIYSTFTAEPAGYGRVFTDDGTANIYKSICYPANYVGNSPTGTPSYTNTGHDCTLALSAPTLGTLTTSTGGTLSGTYYYKVSACDANGACSVASNENHLSSLSSNKVNLTWNAVTGAVKYRVWRGTTSGSENQYYDVTTGTPLSTSLTDTGGLTFTAGTPPTPITFNYENLSGSAISNIPAFYDSGAGSSSFNWRVQAKVVTPFGVVQEIGNKARFGLAGYNNNQGGNIVVPIGNNNYTTVVNAINNVTPANWTPLSEALWSIVGYFAHTSTSTLLGINPTTANSTSGPLYTSGDYPTTAATDPYNNFTDSNNASVYAPCVKSYVLLITDGNPTYDGSLPAALTTYVRGKTAYNCEPYATSATSSSTCGNGTDCACPAAGPFVASTIWEDGAGATGGLEDVAYYMHTTDLRSDLVGSQTIDLYSIFAFGSGATLLQYAAINGSFVYSSTHTSPSITAPYADWTNDTTNYVPNNYFEASDGFALQTSLRAILQTIIKKAASGTAASVLGEKTREGSSLLQAMFYPSQDFDISNPPGTITLSWLGYLDSLWYYEDTTNGISNMREDTVNDDILNLQNDNVISFDFVNNQVVVHSWQDTNGDGTPDVALPDKLIDDVALIWEAGKILFQRDTSARPRKIFVNDNSTAYPKSPTATTCGGGNFVAFSTANKACFSSYLGADLNNDGTVNSFDSTQADKLINYIIGTDYPEYRGRTLPLNNPVNASVTGTWKLGDIIYSTPAVVTYSNTFSDYSVVYVGANDGMLHAFKVGKVSTTGLSGTSKSQLTLGSKDSIALGDELWGFIPQNILPYLRYYADPNYCHSYMIDLSPYVYTYGSNKILIGGMRLGGGCGGTTSTLNPPADTCTTPTASSNYPTSPSSCVGMSSYFALDVKDPNNPKLLWEFADPSLKFSFSGPAVININNTRFAMFLSGPSDYSGNSNQNLKVFVLKLNTDNTINTVYTKDMGASYANSFGGRLFTKGLDLNEDGNTDYVFFGYSKCTNCTTSPTYPQWGGGIFKVYINGADPTQWVYNEYVNFGNANGFPITTKIGIDKCFDKYYLYFTSGRYFTSTEMYNTSTGPVTNKSDIVAGVPFTCTYNNVCTPASINMPTVPTPPPSPLTAAQRITQANTNATGVCSNINPSSMANAGWYVALDPYAAANTTANPPTPAYYMERGVTDPVTTGANYVMFVTATPSADICSFSGTSRIWAFNCATGGMVTNSTCSGKTVNPSTVKGTLLMQLSTAAVNQVNLKNTFTGAGAVLSTPPTSGMPPPNPPPITPSGTSDRVIHWLEK